MKVFRNVSDVREYVNKSKKEGKKVGFVPTMGYLHAGHLSLVKEALQNADIVGASVFVNPTQFAPGEDYEKYPRDFARDEALLKEAGTDFVFYPNTAEVYSKSFSTYVSVDGITGVLEGKTRPTHFRGVTTVVSILFNIVKPDVAVFGRKDAQQAAVINKMVKDLHLDIEVITAPIIRESDGLAMSSRNMYLSESERAEAPVLYKSLTYAKNAIGKGERNAVKLATEITSMITAKKNAVPDYVKIVSTDTFEDVDTLKEGEQYYILLACKFGNTRLIDNFLMTV